MLDAFELEFTVDGELGRLESTDHRFALICYLGKVYGPH
jgi:hypothetical protein